MCGTTRAIGALAVASVFTAALAAQQLQPHRFGVAVGRSVPAGSYHSADNGLGFSSGWLGMALASFTVPGWPVGIRVDATYSTNVANDRLKDSLTAALGQPADEKTKLLGANLDATYPFGSKRVRPYVLGGLGVYHTTISVTSGGTTADNAATKVSWNLGGGVLYQLASATLFLEARYINVAAVSGFPRTTWFPIVAGFRVGAPH